MEKSKAIELLKQALADIPRLRGLPYDNQAFRLWRATVETIMKEGPEDDDYERLDSVQSKYFPDELEIDNLLLEENYLPKLNDYEVALKSIIQKYELLGVESNPDIEELPKGNQDYEGKAATQELELLLEGTPDMILECIRVTTENLNSQGYTYSHRRTSGKPDYARWDRTYFASCAISQGTEGRIGTISLQLIPNERTLLKTSHPKDWVSSFKHFLDALFAEFEQLGYIKKEKKAIVEALPPEALTAKPNWKAIEGEFDVTKRKFGKRINFITDPFKRTIIFRDVEQAFILASLGFSKPAVILAGGVIEELLRLYLDFKGFKPIKKDFDGYVQTCEQEGLLKAGISRLSDSVRHFRNLVHLSKEETKRHTISKSAAKGAVASIFTIANDFEVADQHLDSLRAKKEEYKKVFS